MQNQLSNERSKYASGLKRVFKHEAMPLFLVLVAIAVCIACVNENFISFRNIRNILTQVSVSGILTLGIFVIMLSGNTDLSVAWMLMFLCNGATVLMTEHGWPIWITLISVFIVAILLETFMGFIIAKTKVAAFIVSIGFQSIYTSFTYLITNGSERSLKDRLEWLNQFPLGISTLVYIFAGMAVLYFIMLKYTKFGRRIYAVGCNNEAAFLAGINVTRFKILLFSLNGFMVGLAAVMQMARLNSASPNMATGLEINAVAACVVGGTAMAGGKGNLLGVIVGIVLLGITKNAMTMLGWSPYLADFTKGFIIVVSVVVAQVSANRAGQSQTQARNLRRLSRGA